ncbi:hypothetical protein HAX54_039511 [Datura stramonium]|uniref:Ribosomal RNA methyltransferase SPB1-like C-terminal domain-containing protein n=1 Tax=Datura stramonium TaxID=4076 RepID=A0ABS8VMS2_DATST|nr:hypothetical protein [Datura stramonium]
MRAQFKAIDARPAKKVAEAKARSKRKMIEKLYRKAATTKKPEREYVVAKKGVQVKVGKGKVLVDPRMEKKDARKHE